MQQCNPKIRAVWFLMVAGLAIMLNGCGDRGPERVRVSGLVTYDGKPVAEGRIRFTPDASSNMPVSGAYIVDGRYQADSHGGVPVGAYKVQIEAYTPTDPSLLPDLAGKGKPNAGKAGFGQQYLPAKYNVDTQIEMTIPPGSGAITKDFDLVP